MTGRIGIKSFCVKRTLLIIGQKEVLEHGFPDPLFNLCGSHSKKYVIPPINWESILYNVKRTADSRGPSAEITENLK